MDIQELDEILIDTANLIKERIINELKDDSDSEEPNEETKLNRVDELNKLAKNNPNRQDTTMPDLRQAMLILVRRNMQA